MNETRKTSHPSIRIVLLRSTLIIAFAILQVVALDATVSGQTQQEQINEKLTTIRDQMKLAAESLNTELPDNTLIGTQKNITDELRTLVRQFSAGQQSGDPNASKQSNPGSTQSGTTAGSGIAAAEPNDETTDTSGTAGQLNDSELILNAWGQMPGELSQQRGNAISPRFLPKYERLIREYYRRMSR